jgi:hypothetical protein
MEKVFHTGLVFSKCGQQFLGFTNSGTLGQNSDKLIAIKKTPYFLIIYNFML